MEVLGIAGSLRRESINRSMLKAASRLARATMHIVEHDLADVPLYNGDVEQQGDPEGVSRLKAAIRQADGVVIVTPEYQHGIPGVLKNALDWASRPPGESVLQDPSAGPGSVARPGIVDTSRRL